MKFEKIIKIILILATVITLALIINYIIKENNSAQAAVDAVTEMSESVRERQEEVSKEIGEGLIK